MRENPFHPSPIAVIVKTPERTEMRERPERRAWVVVGCVDGLLHASDRSATTFAVQCFSHVTVCNPAGDDPALRYALAAGCTSIAGSLDGCTAPICLMGRGGAGIDGELSAARLAKKQRATLILDVLQIEWAGDELQVIRDLGRGARECYVLSGPAVLMMSEEAQPPRYISHYRQSRVSVPHELGTDSKELPITWEPVRLRSKTAGLASKTGGEARSRMFDAFGLDDPSPSDTQHVVTGSAELCAEHLVRFLAHHGFVASSIPADGEPTFAKLPTTATDVPSAKPIDPRLAAGVRQPRSVSRSTKGLHRRPQRYVRQQPFATGKLSRGPRVLSTHRPAGQRGPFALSENRDSLDG